MLSECSRCVLGIGAPLSPAPNPSSTFRAGRAGVQARRVAKPSQQKAAAAGPGELRKLLCVVCGGAHLELERSWLSRKKTTLKPSLSCASRLTKQRKQLIDGLVCILARRCAWVRKLFPRRQLLGAEVALCEEAVSGFIRVRQDAASPLRHRLHGVD